MASMDELWLIGAGQMAQGYAAVLSGQAVAFRAISRAKASAERFHAATGRPCDSGGLAAALTSARPARAIVATGVAELAGATSALLRAGVRDILLEKPGATDVAGLEALAREAKAADARVALGYNRRFLASVEACRAMIAQDGGALSMTFEFSELGDRVGALDLPAPVLANWWLANSSHVFDLAFHLAGAPVECRGTRAGALPWHPPGARFVGSGVCASGAPFAYFADWEAPGRWGVEIGTKARRLVLRPMEALQIQRRGSFALEPHPLDDALDRRFKPGLFRQVEAFLAGDPDHRLARVETHARLMRTIYDRIVQAPRLDG